jgi:hypothetical protein
VQLKAMEIMRRIQSAERGLKEKFKQLDQKIAIAATGHLFNEILEKYSDFPEVQRYLQALQEMSSPAWANFALKKRSSPFRCSGCAARARSRRSCATRST